MADHVTLRDFLTVADACQCDIVFFFFFFLLLSLLLLLLSLLLLFLLLLQIGEPEGKWP